MSRLNHSCFFFLPTDLRYIFQSRFPSDKKEKKKKKKKKGAGPCISDGPDTGYFIYFSITPYMKLGRLTTVRLRRPQEQCYPALPACDELFLVLVCCNGEYLLILSGLLGKLLLPSFGFQLPRDLLHVQSKAHWSDVVFIHILGPDIQSDIPT